MNDIIVITPLPSTDLSPHTPFRTTCIASGADNQPQSQSQPPSQPQPLPRPALYKNFRKIAVVVVAAFFVVVVVASLTLHHSHSLRTVCICFSLIIYFRVVFAVFA